MLDPRRRHFLTLLVAAAAAWPLVVRAQQPERMRRIGILMPYPKSDAEAQARVQAVERAIASLADQPNGGAFFPPDLTTTSLRTQVSALLIRHRVPAIFTVSAFIAAGGLVSYGADILVMFRQSASYVDRILRGEKPGDLPFLQPTIYRLVINLGTAKTLGLQIPDKLLALADEVIE